MDITKLFEEEFTEKIRQEIKSKLDLYENKVYLDNKDIVRELGITSAANLRKRLDTGMYKELYEPKQSKKERYRWNKYKFFKWLFDEKLKALNGL